jgi:hypothetical protein
MIGLKCERNHETAPADSTAKSSHGRRPGAKYISRMADSFAFANEVDVTDARYRVGS